MNGHAMVMDDVLRADTLTRTMLRWDEWEGGTEAMAGGREGGTPVRCGEKTQQLLKRGAAGYQSWWALAGTLLPLHYYYSPNRNGLRVTSEP